MQELDQLINNYLYRCYQKVMNDELICIREREAAEEYVTRQVFEGHPENVDLSKFRELSTVPSVLSNMDPQERFINLFLRYYRFGKMSNSLYSSSFYTFLRKNHLMEKYRQREKLDYYSFSSDELTFIDTAFDVIGDHESLYLEKMNFLDMSFKYFQYMAKQVKAFKILYPYHEVSMKLLPKDIYKSVVSYFKNDNIDCMKLEKFIGIDERFKEDYRKAQVVKRIYPEKKVLYLDLPKNVIQYVFLHYGETHDLSDTNQLQETFPMISFPQEIIDKIHLYKEMFPNTVISSKIVGVPLIYATINYILEDHSYEEITEMLAKTGKDIALLRGAVPDYLIANHYKDEQYEIQRAKIKEKLDQYVKQRQKIKEGKRKEQKNKQYQALQEQAPDIIRDFIASGMSRREYTKKHNNTTLFVKCKNIVRDTEPELYREYTDITTGTRNSQYSALSKIAYDIIAKVNRPIELSDGTKRPYDILDFYEERIDHFPAVYSVASRLDPVDRQQLQHFKSFVTKNKLLKEPHYFSKNKILEEKVVIHVAFDASGNVIEGSGHVVSEAEKLSIMDYLVQHKIPLNDITYQAAFKRFRTNTLFDNKSDPKVNRKNFT